MLRTVIIVTRKFEIIVISCYNFSNFIFRTVCLFWMDGHLQLHHTNFPVFMCGNSKILWQYVCSMGQEFERWQNWWTSYCQNFWHQWRIGPDNPFIFWQNRNFNQKRNDIQVGFLSQKAPKSYWMFVLVRQYNYIICHILIII